MYHDHWPQELVRAFPKLLSVLIKKGDPQSLERLQLMKIEIEHSEVGADTGLGPALESSIVKKSDGSIDWLTVIGELLMPDNKRLRVFITYFLRGQRKFFKTDMTLPSLPHEIKLAPLSLDDVAGFFDGLDQSNSFFTDQKLAELNGRAQPPIPSQMLMALMLDQSVKVMPEKRASFNIIFHRALWAGQALRFCYNHGAEGFFAALYADDMLALSLSALS